MTVPPLRVTGKAVARLLEEFRRGFEEAGITEEDVPRIIEEVRRERRAKRAKSPSRA